VAGGGNACILHYTVNKEQIQDGDLVLMDFGANYGNYASDLTRTIPANGRFTQRQREVYNAVLHVQRSAMDLLRPGKPFKEYNEAVGELMDEQLLKLGLLNQSDIDDQDPDWPARKQFFPHGVSHYIGLDTHDVGDMTATFQPGMVFTVEPGIYIPDEGIGIRLENDVLVTENEPHDLMHFIPIEAEAIEGLMNQYRERS
jgi:Xaa-Pro aminopeptidase